MRGSIEFVGDSDDPTINACPIIESVGLSEAWNGLLLHANRNVVEVLFPAGVQRDEHTAALQTSNTFTVQRVDNQLNAYVNGRLALHESRLGVLSESADLRVGVGAQAMNPAETILTFSDLQLRRLDGLPARGRIDRRGPAEPIRPIIEGYDPDPATASDGKSAGQASGEPFRHVLAGPGWLCGLRVALRPTEAGREVCAIQPIYQTPTGRRLGPRIGAGTQKMIDIVAPTGWGVSEITVFLGEYIEGLQLTFVTPGDDGGWTGISRRSGVVGVITDNEQVLGASGRSIGLFGHVDESVNELGLIGSQPAGAEWSNTPRPLLTPSPPDHPPADAVALGGRHFLYVDMPVTWDDAARYCERLGGRLAMVDTIAINGLAAQLAGGRPVWTDSEPDAPGAWRGFVCEWDDPRPAEGRAEPLANVELTPRGANWDGHRYEVFDGPVTWAEAKAICREQGGRLVTIDHADENQLVFLLSGGQERFIGATDDAAEGDWRWIDGRPIDYANWADGEPNNTHGGQHAAVIGFRGTAQWDDVTPLHRVGFICEWDDDPLPPTDAEADLADGVTGAIEVDGRWIKAYYDATGWEQARALAERLGGSLLRIDSADVSRFAFMLVKTGQPVWIGAARTDGRWQWTDGDELTFAYWSTGQPGDDSGPPAAAAIGSTDQGHWHAAILEQRYGFICQWATDPNRDAAEAP
jgi:hypothetical protein